MAAGERGFGKQAGNLKARDLDAALQLLPGGGAQQGERARGEQQRQRGGVAQFAVCDVADILQSGVEIESAGARPVSPGIPQGGLVERVRAY